MKRLVVLRHAKSDWTQPVSDRQRPITSRGARQASEAGEWLAAQPWQIDLALVSPAVRASSAWDLAAAHLDAVPTQRVEDAYTFDGDALLALVRRQPADLTTIVVVSHNPAVEELVEAGTLDPNQIHTPGIFVQRIFQGEKYEKRIEKRTVRERKQL